jgi:hypothetical protein
MMRREWECNIANTAEAREQVYRLRYACYRRDEAIGVRADEKFRDEFDELPNHFSFLLGGVHEPMATARISVVRRDWQWDDAPVEHVFGDDPTLRSIASEGYVETSRLCFARAALPGAFVRLVSQIGAVANFYDVEWFVACPRLEHVHSWARMFGYKPIAAPRQYYGVAFQTQLLAVRRRDAQKHLKDGGTLQAACDEAAASLRRSLPVIGAEAARVADAA